MVLNERNLQVRNALRGMFYSAISSIVTPSLVFILLYILSPWPRKYDILVEKINYWIPFLYRRLFFFSIFVGLYTYYISQLPKKPLYHIHLSIANLMSYQSRMMLRTIITYFIFSLTIYAMISLFVPIWNYSYYTLGLYYFVYSVFLLIFSLLISNYEQAGMLLSRYIEEGSYDDLFNGMIQVNHIARGMLPIEDVVKSINVIEASMLYYPDGDLRTKYDQLTQDLLNLNEEGTRESIRVVFDMSLNNDSMSHLVRKPKLPLRYAIRNQTSEFYLKLIMVLLRWIFLLALGWISLNIGSNDPRMEALLDLLRNLQF